MLFTNVLLVLACCSTLVFVWQGSNLHKWKNRILYGATKARKGEFPWQVSIQHSINGDRVWTPWCSGSIISSEFIITIGSCAASFPASLRVVAGTIEWAWPGSKHNVTEFINSENTFFSLWRVHPPFEFGPDIQAIRLPAQGTESQAGTLMTTSSWSAASPGESSDFLMKMDTWIVSRAECSGMYSRFGGIDQNQICAGMPNSGVCFGAEDGSPLVHKGELRGVFFYAGKCGVDPGVFYEVSAFRDWIYQNAAV